jgi:predicted NodU family carbamoyl transferase
MKILGINISHDFSICIYEDKKILGIFYEDRFILHKRFVPGKKNFLLSIFEKINFKPDQVIYSSFGRIAWDEVQDNDIIFSIQKQLGNPPFFFEKKHHHIYHACSSFYFSKFDEAMAIVIDGGGSLSNNLYREIQSIFYINKKNVFTLFKNLSCLKYLNIPKNYPIINFKISDTNTWVYEDGVETIFTMNPIGGLHFVNGCEKTKLNEEPGKLMGLSSYGYTEKKYNLNYEFVEIAKYCQEITFKETCELIEKSYNYKKIKNFVLSGGYFLNCSNNFKYVKKYPEFNFFVDPDPSDGGTALGACVYYDNYK